MTRPKDPSSVKKKKATKVTTLSKQSKERLKRQQERLKELQNKSKGRGTYPIHTEKGAAGSNYFDESHIHGPHFPDGLHQDNVNQLYEDNGYGVDPRVSNLDLSKRRTDTQNEHDITNGGDILSISGHVSNSSSSSASKPNSRDNSSSSGAFGLNISSSSSSSSSNGRSYGFSFMGGGQQINISPGSSSSSSSSRGNTNAGGQQNNISSSSSSSGGQQNNNNSGSSSRPSNHGPPRNPVTNPNNIIPVFVNPSPVDAIARQKLCLDRLRRVTLSELLSENAIQDNTKFIDVQLLRMVSPVNIPGVSGAYTYASNRNRNRNTGGQTNYTRLFLCRVYSQNEGERLVYLMETKTQNTLLWGLNPTYRDNGVLSIGTVFRVLAPRPVDQLMYGDVPLLVTKFKTVIMKLPRIFPDVPVELGILGDTSLGFCIVGATLKLTGLTPVQTTCSGLLCDKARVSEWSGTERGCGCYSMHHRRSNIAFQFDVEVTDQYGHKFTMSNFSSHKFMKLFFSHSLNPGVMIQSLQFTAEFFDLMDCCTIIVDGINIICGFIVIGWYKRGLINDRLLVSRNNNQRQQNEDVQVDNGEINYHICQILPTDADFFNPNTVNGRWLDSKKFDVSKLK